MEKKQKKISFIALALSMAIGGVALASSSLSEDIIGGYGTDNTPSILFSREKNYFFGTGSSDVSKEGDSTLYSEQGTPIGFSYYGFSNEIESDSWHVLHSATSTDNQGYYGQFYNTTKITDLTSISITAKTAGSIGVYWSGTSAYSYSTSFPSQTNQYEIHAFEAGGSYTFDFDGDHPNYFFVCNANSTADTITIQNMTVLFGCQTDYWQSLTVASENPDAGSVSGSGYYCAGKEVSVTATSNDGYHFLGWYSGDTQVSTSSTYTFSMPSSSYSLIARFEEWEEVKFISEASDVLNSLPSDFAYGLDMSEVYELEALGANYTDKDGNAIDVFEIIKAAGCNYVRFRLWVDPTSSTTGTSYGGGSNDINADLEMAKRAEAAGLSVMIDYHMSDTYTEPGRQYAPKSWQADGASTYATKAAAHVTETMTKFKEAGVTVDSFQIGNETTTRIADQYFNSSDGYANQIVAQSIIAAKTVFPDAESICHITAAKSSGYYSNWLTYIGNINSLLSSSGYKVDILGFSYYPYYHGASSGLSDLAEQLSAVTNRYPDMKVMVLETAWGYTDDWTDDTNNTFWTYKTDSSCNVADCGYDTSTQAQATEMYDVIKVLSQYGDQGAGIFYWGADWYPVAGTKWISETGYYYINVGKGTSDAPSGTDLSSYTDSCKASWANQALFDYDGQALPSLYTYKNFTDNDNLISTDTVVSPYYGTGELEYACTLDELSSTLDSTVTCATELGRKVDGTVTWDTSSITGDGEYVITGTVSATGYSGTISAKVTIGTNYITDGGFESQSDGSAITDSTTSPWDLTQSVTGAMVASSEAVYSGSLAAKFWYSGTYTFDLSQTITVSDTGYYSFSLYANGYTDYTNPGYLYYSRNGGDNVAGPNVLQSTASDFTLYTFSDIYAEEGDTLKVGIYASCTSSSWGHIDEVSLEETMAIGLRDGSFDNQTAGSVSSPWSLTTSGFTGGQYDHAEVRENWTGWPNSGSTSTANNVFDYYTTVDDSTFALSQTFGALAGTYSLSFYGTSDSKTDFTLSLTSSGTTLKEVTFSGSEIPWTTSDAVGTLYTVSDIVVSETTSITLTISGACSSGAWGRLDVFSFTSAS